MIKRLGMELPIIQAPMAGVTTPEFVAASAEAGMLGSIGAGYLSKEETRTFIRDVQKRTKKPFAVNLFVPEQVEPSEEQLHQASQALQPIRNELGISSELLTLSKHEFDGQVQAILEEGVTICSFTFGLPEEKIIRRLKEAGIFLIGTATTVEEAILAEDAGMDAVVAQGSEAGGHRGSFLGDIKFISLVELLPAIVSAVDIPVIAAGGIATKELMNRMLDAGAGAVQIGTALLASDESGAHPLYKRAIVEAEEGCTALTTAFSGKFARGIRNRFMEEMQEAVIAPYPYQNDLTKEIRKVAASEGKPAFMSLWAGESVHLSREGSVRDLLNHFS
ncbi:hypothetical protein AU377_05320 [Sporosarcina sp. HYO08]|nr:hypothetical protein AU377_05320 [Sporosarcina sp. HYO08]